MILVGVKDNYSDQGDKDRGVQGPTRGHRVEVDHGRQVARDVDALKYLECDLVSKEGLDAVFLEVSRPARPIFGSQAAHR